MKTAKKPNKSGSGKANTKPKRQKEQLSENMSNKRHPIYSKYAKKK